MREALIALGANLDGPWGPPAAAIRRAMGEVAPMLGTNSGARASSLWRSPAWPEGSGPDYVNAAMAVPVGAMAPEAVMAALHAIEARAGRRRGARWAARTMDLDLLAVGSAVAPDAATQSRWREAVPDPDAPPPDPPERLVLPHPRLAERAFVLLPLAEVAPGWRHPLTGRSVAEMLAALPEAQRAQVARRSPGRDRPGAAGA